jgi:ribosomal protein L22
MSAEDEKDPKAQTPPAAKKPAAKKARTKKPAAKAAAAKADDADAPAEKKRAAKTAAAKKPARKEPTAKEPIASEATKPARSKDAAKPARRRVVRAHARYVRTSARKARMVCGHLRGKTVGEARAILAFTPRDVARDWSKLLESAVANAESNHELLEDELIVREAYADEGPTIKRFRPRAMGRATPIRKRTSHLTITLTPGAAARTTKRNG